MRDTETDRETQTGRGKEEREREAETACLSRKKEIGSGRSFSPKRPFALHKLDLLPLYRGVTVPGFQEVPGQ